MFISGLLLSSILKKNAETKENRSTTATGTSGVSLFFDTITTLILFFIEIYLLYNIFRYISKSGMTGVAKNIHFILAGLFTIPYSLLTATVNRDELSASF